MIPQCEERVRKNMCEDERLRLILQKLNFFANDFNDYILIEYGIWVK